MSIELDELIQYWQGELPAQREAEVEEALFEDTEVARRLDAIARLSAGVRNLVAAGRLESGLSVEGVQQLEAAGLKLRTYRVRPGEVVPCSIADEDLTVVRLCGEFGGAEQVDVIMNGTFEGLPDASERISGVLVDRRAGEVVLVYSGDRIRALPRSRFVYRVRSGDQEFGEYGLDHHPNGPPSA